MRRTIHLFAACIALMAWPVFAFGVTTKQWTGKTIGGEIESYDGMAYSDRGQLRIGHSVEKKMYKENYSFWAGAVDFDNGLIVGGGTPARLFKLQASGFVAYDVEYSLNNQLDHGSQSITTIRNIPKQHAILAGLSGSGAVLILKTGEQVKLLCTLPVENTWRIEDGGDGFAFAATGPLGQVFRINVATGEYTQWSQTKDTNIGVVHRGKNGTLYAGGRESANLYAIESKEEVETVHHFPEDAILGIVDYKNGLLIATGKMRRSPDEKGEDIYKSYYKKFSELDATYGISSKSASFINQMQSWLSTFESSAVYYIDTEHRVEKLFMLPGEYVLDMKIDADNRVFIATGPNGKVYMAENILGGDREMWTWLDTDYKNIPAIVMNGGVPWYCLGSGNEAVSFEVKKELSPTGSFKTKVFSPGQPAQWGRLSWKGTGLSVSSRHGNSPKPDNTWTKWIERKTGNPAELNKSVYVYGQLKFQIKNGAWFDGFAYYYMEKNQRPFIGDVTVGESAATKDGIQRQISWEATDPNNDKLSFRVWVKKEEGGSQWIEITGGRPLAESKHTLSASTLPDGGYRVKVEANDEAMNYMNGLTFSRISKPFLIDNGRPEFSGFAVVKDKNMITGAVTDKSSIITGLEFSVDGGAWTAFFPADGVFDDRSEIVNLPLPANLSKGAHTISVRARDEAGNEATAIVNVEM